MTSILARNVGYSGSRHTGSKPVPYGHKEQACRWQSVCAKRKIKGTVRRNCFGLQNNDSTSMVIPILPALPHNAFLRRFPGSTFPPGIPIILHASLCAPAAKQDLPFFILEYGYGCLTHHITTFREAAPDTLTETDAAGGEMILPAALPAPTAGVPAAIPAYRQSGRKILRL